MSEMQKHFVNFYSPGTFLCEETVREIKSWDVSAASLMATEIQERYNATPFGFQFTTRSRDANDLDSKETARSPMYYLGGTIRTIEQVRTDAKDDEDILLRNMEMNGYTRVITNNNSWKFTGPLKDDDIVLDSTQ